MWALPKIKDSGIPDAEKHKILDKLFGVPVIVSMLQGNNVLEFRREDGIEISFPISLPKKEKREDR